MILGPGLNLNPGLGYFAPTFFSRIGFGGDRRSFLRAPQSEQAASSNKQQSIEQQCHINDGLRTSQEKQQSCFSESDYPSNAAQTFFY
jgi:hypothetical protein